MINSNNDSNDINDTNDKVYRGRIAPSPSGHLHKGHAHTFCIAYNRASSKLTSKLILRVEDLDKQRCKTHYLNDMIEDLEWIGIKWDEGYNYNYNDSNEQLNYMKSCIYSNNDNNLIYSLLNHINTINNTTISMQYINALQSYKQSDRLILYKYAWFYLFKKGYIYPSHHSRKDVETALSAPHNDNFNRIKVEGVDNDVIFPKALRPDYVNNIYAPNNNQHFPDDIKALLEPSKVNWRYRVPDQESIKFYDKRCGDQEYKSDIDFGDFLVWRLDGYPSYELAVVVDDILMNITEIVRGEDLLLSTARQILLYNAFGIPTPDFYHCPLVTDPNTGKRLAKSEKALSLRQLRAANVILNVDTIFLVEKKDQEVAARQQTLEKIEKERKKIESDREAREAQLEASRRCSTTLFCCPCICFSVTCLAIATGRDNDEYCCACCGWDFLECRQESKSCCEICEGSCISDCLAYCSSCCRMSPGLD